MFLGDGFEAEDYGHAQLFGLRNSGPGFPGLPCLCLSFICRIEVEESSDHCLLRMARLQEAIGNIHCVCWHEQLGASVTLRQE